MPHDIGNPGATIKNPPAVFARQANIAHGPQQVNNGARPASVPVEDTLDAANHESDAKQLREAHVERLDVSAAQRAGHRDTAMATVGTIKRSAHS